MNITVYKTLIAALLLAILILAFSYIHLANKNELLLQGNQAMQAQYMDAVSRIDKLQQQLLIRQQDAIQQNNNFIVQPKTVQGTGITVVPGDLIDQNQNVAVSTPPPASDALGDISPPGSANKAFTSANEKLMNLDYEKAIDAFSTVDENSPEYLRARQGIAQSYFYAHRYQRAADEFEFILERDADMVQAAIGLANSYQRLGLHEKQVAALNLAIKTEPDNWLHYNGRATARLAQGEFESAMEDYRQAADLAGENNTFRANALENIGIIFLSREDWQSAFDHANEVNEIEETLGWNWLFRGIAAAQMERNIDAYVSYDKWFRYKKATDPYLLKQLLPESLYDFIDTSAKDLPRLIDPPLLAGDSCVNDYQCKSQKCRPGAPDNAINYCVAESQDCATPGGTGHLAGDYLEIAGIKVRCYIPLKANPRWTRDES